MSQKFEIFRNQSGQGLTEYITLLLLISICSIAAARGLGGTIKRKIEMSERHILKMSPTDTDL